MVERSPLLPLESPRAEVAIAGGACVTFVAVTARLALLSLLLSLGCGDVNRARRDAGGDQDTFQESGRVRHAVRVGSDNWDLTTVDSTDDVGANKAIRVDGDGGVHIAYSDETNSSLKYAYRGPDDDSFAPETADNDGSVGQGFIGMALDGSGGIHISYIDQGDQDVKYAFLCP